MKKQIKIKTWIIFEGFGRNKIPYILDASDLNVDGKELALCIQEQIYGGENFK